MPRTAPHRDLALRVWAVDVSGWLETASDKGTLAGLADSFFGGTHEDVHRVTKYVRAIDRTRSLAAMLLPRVAIVTHGTELGAEQGAINWSDLSFDRTKEGRPFLTKPSLPTLLDFNISHDADWVVLAFRAQRTASESDENLSPSSNLLANSPLGGRTRTCLRVGVDVMSLCLPHFEESPATFLETMSESVTPAESKWISSALGVPPPSRSTSEQHNEVLQRLYDLWTYKEALTKNLGLGLGFDFKRVQVGLWKCSDAHDRGQRCSSPGARGAVLELDGVAEPGYSFTEVCLPAGDANRDPQQRAAGSKIVVCQGPHSGDSAVSKLRRQITPAVTMQDALHSGLLRVWTMRELVDEAAKLQNRGVNGR